MTEETKIETAPESTPQTELERVRAGENKTFDAPALCALLCQLLAHPDYWEGDGYLVHMQFHRDEVRTIANFMSIGIGAATPSAQPGDEALIPTGPQFDAALIPSHEEPALDSAVLGEFVQDADLK